MSTIFGRYLKKQLLYLDPQESGNLHHDDRICIRDDPTSANVLVSRPGVWWVSALQRTRKRLAAPKKYLLCTPIGYYNCT